MEAFKNLKPGEAYRACTWNDKGVIRGCGGPWGRSFWFEFIPSGSIVIFLRKTSDGNVEVLYQEQVLEININEFVGLKAL